MSQFSQLEGALANLDDLIGSMTNNKSTSQSSAPSGDVDLDAIIADLNRSFPATPTTPSSQPLTPASRVSEDDTEDYEFPAPPEPYADYAQLGDDEVFKEELGDDIGPLNSGQHPRGSPLSQMKRSNSLPTPSLFPDGRLFPDARSQSTSTIPPHPNIPVPLPPRDEPQAAGPAPGMMPPPPPPMPPEIFKTRSLSDRKMSLPEDEREWKAQLFRQASQKISSDRRKEIMNFYNTDRSYKTLAVEPTHRARDICNKLVLKNMVMDDKNWMLVEFITQFNIQRVIEDHEVILDIYDLWGGNMDNLFYFKNDYKKYEIFQNPAQFFPPHMIQSEEDEGVLTEKAEKARKILLQNLFSTTDRVPDIESYLYLKEQGKKTVWKRAFCMLRGTRIVYSTKGTSKDPKHLVTFTIFDDLDLYLARTAKDTFGSPTDFCFCLKPKKLVKDAGEILCLCADDPRSLKCWMAGIRLAKYGSTLRENYRIAVRRMEKLQKMRKKGSEEDSRVSGPYASQPWYHGAITREETSSQIVRHGLNDGAFLVRDSQSSPGSYVISFVLKKKIKHFQVRPMKTDQETLYSLDEGRTKFPDVIDLVNYYSRELGVMPVLLKDVIRRT